MHLLPSKYEDFFPIVESRPWSEKNHAFAYFMAFDAEWYESGGQNIVISYQIATLSTKTSQNIIQYVAPEQRLTLAEIVELGIKSVNGGEIPESHCEARILVVLISHHVTAEWSVLADRKEPYITKKINVIRKSPVTGISPIQREIKDCSVDVRICDTRLTAPVDFQSLAKLSTLLGSENDLKISIEHYYKKRMNIFQRNSPEEFEKYALQDSQVTLKLFFLLQKSLMELAFGVDSLITTVSVAHGTLTCRGTRATITGNGTKNVVIAGTLDENNEALHRMEYTPSKTYFKPIILTLTTEDLGETGRGKPHITDQSIKIRAKWINEAKKTGGSVLVSAKVGIKKKKIFSTLASAAVAGYINKYPNFKAYQRLLQSKHFSDAYKLVKRAYHGGRNEGYIVGHSEEHEETRGRVWVDIDFVGCYPTAMALCPLIKCGVNLSGHKLKKDDIDYLIKNFTGSNTYIPLVYRLDDKSDEDLKKAGIPADVYRAAKTALDKLSTLVDRKERNQAIQEFDRILSNISKPSEKGLTRIQARKIREMAQVKNNKLINKWYKAWTTAKENKDTRPEERYIIPGFAHIRFDFKGKTDYPCLPVIHPKYGLIYPLKGECTVTASEIMLALDAGAEIHALTSLELPVEMDESLPENERIPKRLFFNHLAWLTKKRMEQKKISIDELSTDEDRQKAKVMERLLKEFLNSFYGKTAQAIRHRKSYRPSTGEMAPLLSSPISEPCAAALATGLPRAALSAVLLAVEKYNRQKFAGKQISPNQQILVVSATTDGLLLGLPRPEGFSLTGEGGYYQMTDKGFKLRDDRTDVLSILQRCGCGKLMELIEEYLPIKQMRNSRKELTDGKKDTYLEVKNMADYVLGVKTRGQIGWIKYKENEGDEGRNIVTIQAKFGIKPPLSDIIMNKSELEGVRAKEEEYGRVYEEGGSEKATWEGDWIHEQVKRIEAGEEKIFDYDFYGLTGFNEMMKSEAHIDLVQKIGKKKFNADFDWKRKLTRRKDGTLSPITVPHQDVTEMLAHRSQMERERRRGRNARPDKVLHLTDIRGRKTRSRGGDQAMVVRCFLRGIIHNFIPGAQLGKSYTKAAERLNRVWRDLGCTMQDSLVRQDGKSLLKTSSKTEWTRDDFKNAKKNGEKDEGLILPTPKLEQLVEELSKEFGANPDQAKSQIFALEQEDVSKALAVQVVQAVLQAPMMGLEPYRTLYQRGLLPDNEQLMRALQPHMTEDLLRVCAINIFQTNTRPPTDRPRLVRIFRRLGLITKDAEECARIIAQPAPQNTKPRRNPAVTKCMESFAQAVLQQDIVQQRITKKELLDRLRGYGLSQSRLSSLGKGKFVPRTLTNTPANRQQINKMAKSLGLDPSSIADAILDK